MGIEPGNARPADIPSRALFPYLALTFLITWGLIGAYILAPDAASATFGDISGSHPFFFVATWSPGIAAFIVLLFYAGLSGVRAFLSRLLLWRVPPAWAVFVLLIIPLVFMIGSRIKDGPMIAPLPPEGGVQAVVMLMFMMLLLGPLEEFGWRGVMQPLLQRHIAPLWAGLIVGATWGLWHLPAFFLAGVVFADWSFLPFFVGNVVLAILVTPLFNQARGSLLWPMLFHWQLINPFWPDAQPWDTWILVIIAAMVVWWNRDNLLSRDQAVTHVLPASLDPSATQPAHQEHA